MFSLIGYEFKKIIKNKVNIISILIMTLIILYSFIPKIINYSTTTEDNDLLKGIKAVRYETNYLNERFDKPLASNKILGDIKDLKKLTKNTNEEFYDPKNYMDKKDYNSLFLPLGGYYSWISESYEGLDDKPYWVLSDLLNYNDKLDDFYNYRMMKVEKSINNSQTIKNHPKERQYWKEKAIRTNGPYNYGYYEGWSSINDTFDIYVLLILLVVAISISGVFSRENESNMVSIILSSRNGVKKLSKAKIIASGLYIVLLSLIMILILTIPNLCFYGTSGWNFPVQILNTKILYSWNLLDLYLIRIAISLVTALSFGSLCLFLSSITKKTYIVNVISMLFIIASFLLPDVRNRLFVQIAMLLPLQLNGVLYYSYISYSLFGKIFNIYQIGPVINVLIMILLSLIAALYFRKQELK